MHKDLALKVIMDCGIVDSCKFKSKFVLNPLDIINSKQQTVLEEIKGAFKGENVRTEYSILGYRVGLYFHDYKLAIEVDEFGHTHRSINYEIQRRKAIQKKLGCKFIKINPDE